MSAETIAPRIRVTDPIFLGVLLAQVAKRIGLGPALVRFALKQMGTGKRAGKAFGEYQPNEHDVLVATFAKSGTNWMMQIAQQIAHRGEAEFDHIHEVVAWPDAPGGRMVAITDPAPLEQSPTGLRVIKTHLPTESVPYDEKATYLTVLRDPKEVLISSYYFLGGVFGVLSHVTIDDWFEIFTAPDSMAKGWAAHTASFWDWRDRPNVLVLTFGEVKERPHESIERVAALMGVTLTEAELSNVVERSSFAYMQAHESQFAPPQPPFTKEGNETLMVRRGQSGGSGELLNPAQQAEVDRICQAELQRIGSDFPYESAFPIAAEPAA